MRIIPTIHSWATVMVFIGATATHAATVPGEKWQQTTTMKMSGMSMPVGTQEVCAPAGQAEEQLMKPEKNCQISNVQRAGNRMSADVECTGKDAVKGKVVLTGDANHMTSTITTTSNEGEMTLVMESRKLGACQAIDVKAAVANAERMAASAPKVDVCADLAATVRKKPVNVVAAVSMFTAGGQCANASGKADFCGAVQSRAGFSALMNGSSQPNEPTTRSVGACGLGQGKAGVDALRAKLVTGAEHDGDAAFLETYAPERARQIARTECVLKGEMWAGKSAKWDTFCDSNFADAARKGR